MRRKALLLLLVVACLETPPNPERSNPTGYVPPTSDEPGVTVPFVTTTDP